MAGRLTLDSRHLVFEIYEQSYSCVLQYGWLTPTGKMISVSLGNIVDVSVEPRSRVRGSRQDWSSELFFQDIATDENAGRRHGYLGDYERHVRLMITASTPLGVELVRFDVQHPEDLELSLRDYFAERMKRA
jgi:hypothetical protein